MDAGVLCCIFLNFGKQQELTKQYVVLYQFFDRMQKNLVKPKQKKKNIQTGIIMGQNTNVFSQLSATFLQHKSSTTEQQQAFLKNTQVVEYHDQNINRLISLLRKKAEVTKIKAALELHEQIDKMSAEQVQEFISTFAQLYLEIAVNEPSKQIADEFASIFNDLIAKEKKTVISQISTLYPPLLLTHKLPKLASLLFNGNEEELGNKVLLLLLKKQARKKFIVMTKIIMDCEAKEKILQPQYQRNCQALTKVIRQFIRLFQKNPKSQQLQADFSSFIKEICESFGEACIDEYFKSGGKAKASIIEFYTTLVAISSRRSHWELEWQAYSKTIGNSFLDKDPLVQQSLWKGSVHVWIQSLLLLQSKQANEKQANPLLNIYLPKSDEKLLQALKVGGFGLYKQLPRLCEIFPHTTFLASDTHKQTINKLGFCRKLMAGLLGEQDQNQARMECYAGLAELLIKRTRGITLPDEQKKSKEIKSLITKFQKEVLQNLQDRYYNEPPTSKNQFSYYIPAHFTALINNLQPSFDLKFNPQHTYALYQGLALTPHNYNIINTIFQYSKQSQSYTLKYLEVFPAKKIEIDMSQANTEAETAAKIFLLISKLPAQNEQWLHEDWDIRKKVIAYDPRISQRDLDADEQEQDPNSHTLYFRPTQRNLPALYNKPQLDQIRFNFFKKCLLESQSSHLIKYLIPFMSDILIPRNTAVVDNLLALFVERSRKANEGKWVVGAHQVLVIRVLTQLISEAIIKVRNLSVFNKEHSQEFLLGFCQFVRLLMQYKMQTQTEDLLRKAQSLLVVQQVHPFLLASCQKTVTKAVQVLISGGKDSAQKIRKNRIKKCLELINKLLWFCIPRNNEEQLVRMTIDFVRQQNNWKYALDKSEAWQVAFTFIHSLRSEAINKIVQELLANHQLYVRQNTLLLSVDALLPLQALPDAKKVYTNLKHTIHQSIATLEQAKLSQILGYLMSAIFKGGEIVLAEGLKGLITHLLLSNEQDNTSIVNSFRKALVLTPFDNFVKPLKNINHILLYTSVVSAIPLRRVQQSEKICIQLTELLLKAEGIELLMVIATIGLFWNKGVGSAEATNNDNQLLKSTLHRCLQALNHPSSIDSTQKINFGIYTLFNLVNVSVGLAGKQILSAHQKRIEELFWFKIQKGSDLQAFAQSVKMKYASRAVLTADPHNLKRMITQLPELILQEFVFYKEIILSLDADQDQPQYHENITSLFTEAAEFLLRASAYVSNQRIPSEQTLLELVRCPFPALKKAAFLLLRAIYQGKFVKAQPPTAFMKGLKMQLKGEELNSELFSNSASYFYLWQLLILRRQTTDQDLASEENVSLSLQEQIQSEGLNEIFIRNCFWILEDQLDYLKNQNDYIITPQELLDQDPQTELLQEGDIQQKLFKLTVRTFFVFVSNFPLFLRDFMDRLKKYKNVCQRLLRNVISEAIFREEVTRIELMQQKWKAGGNFQIFVTPKNKEIYAEYTHDVIRIGLRLVMRGTYPLTPIAIEFGQGLKMDQGSRWGLMLQSQLHNRNNTVINGILLWKQNIDKKLSGVEQCAICFDIVNPTGQLPKKACKTCRKKFHGNCIMKWFTKSNKSECPLCKSQFL